MIPTILIGMALAASPRDYDAARHAVQSGRVVTLGIAAHPGDAEFMADEIEGLQAGVYLCWQDATGRAMLQRIKKYEWRKEFDPNARSSHQWRELVDLGVRPQIPQPCACGR